MQLHAALSRLRPTVTRVRRPDGSVELEYSSSLTPEEVQKRVAADEEEILISSTQPFMIEGAVDPQVAPVSASEPLLFVGSQDAAAPENIAELSSRGIVRILNVGSGIPNRLDRVECRGAIYEFSCFSIEALDTEEFELIPADFLTVLERQSSMKQAEAVLVRCFEFIDNAIRDQVGVLVHCNAGVSRSVSVVLAWAMVRHGKSYDAAFAELKAVRQKIRPNDGFVRQLLRLEQKLSAERTAAVPP